MELGTLNKLDKKQFLYELRDYLIPYQDNIGIEDKYSFGIEIEFVGSKHCDIEEIIKKRFIDNWIIVHDQSLNDGNYLNLKRNIYGGEVVSRKLCDNSKNWKEIKKICDMLKANGSYVNKNCGGHVHVGSQILKNKKSLKRFLKLWTVFEDVIYHFSYGEDLSYRNMIEMYAMCLSNTLKQFLDESDKINVHKLNKYLKFYRVYGVSLKKTYAIGKNLPGNTIEFRCPNGTLNAIIWQNNINFFLKLLLRCNEKGNWDIVDKYLKDYKPQKYNLHEYDKTNIEKALILSDFVFDEEMDKRNFMKQYVKNGENQKITY